jgi:GNAT superfamily N-acetyltransferase
MAYPGAALTSPNPNPDFSYILPARITLRNKETREPLNSILRRVDTQDEKETPLLQNLWHLLNYEIVVGGDSYPFESAFTFEQFKGYYASHDLFVLEREFPLEADNTLTVDDVTYNFGKTAIGSMHVRPNFPARSSIVANGAFLVVPQHRRYGGAQALGLYFPILCKMMGYKSTLFNLVFEANRPSVGLWKKLGYPVAGRVACAGLLKDNYSEGEQRGKIIESGAILFSIDLRDEAGLVISLAEIQASSERAEAKKNEGLDLYDDILSHVGKSTFGTFLIA